MYILTHLNIVLLGRSIGAMENWKIGNFFTTSILQ